MAKQRSRYVCRECGHESLAWSGQCSGCSEWNTLEEVVVTATTPPAPVAPPASGAPAPRGRCRCGTSNHRARSGSGPESASSTGARRRPGPGLARPARRLARDRQEHDHAMALGNLARPGRPVLYVTGEESTARSGCAPSASATARSTFRRWPRPISSAVIEAIETECPNVCVVDSVQTLHSPTHQRPGSVGQVREAANGLMEVAKRNGTALILVGHVTKEGRSPVRACSSTSSTACSSSKASASAPTGPCGRSRTASARPASSASSRCAPPGWSRSRIRRPASSARRRRAPGSVVLCAMEGTRPLLVEVQALVAPTEVVPPRRVANGIDRNRLAMILAVLSRHGGVAVGTPTSSSTSPAASASTSRGRSRDRARDRIGPARRAAQRREGRPLACFGEVGLTGELR